MMRKVGLILGLLLALATLAQADDFEHRIVDVRAKAIAGSVTAAGFGVGSLSGNPAGLAAQNRWEAFTTYSDLFGLGFAQQDFSLALPFLGGGLGFAYTTMGNSEDVLYEIASTQLSYGRGSGSLAWGVSLRRGALNSTGGAAHAFALDAGLRGTRGNFSWGIAGHNLYVRTDPVSKAQSVPREIKFGAALQAGAFLLSGELINGQELCFGIEQDLGAVKLRAGFKESSPTFGIGIQQRNWLVDYAYELGELGNTQSLGLSRQF